MANLSAWIWRDSFWFPEGVSFRDFEDKPGITYAKSQDLYCVPIVALGLFVVRVLFERYLALPIAKRHGLSDGKERKPPKPNETLSAYFKNNANPSEEEIKGLSKKLEIPRTFLRRWFRRKRNCTRPDTQTKFCETSWRFVFYTAVFTYGIASLWKSSWFWDHYQCWIGYPHQGLDRSSYIYYILEASFYLSLLFSVMKDVRRKDFTAQMIHHIATITLILFSYVANYIRIGTLVMAIHDVSDVFLEGAKCLHYLNYKNTAELIFVVFAITFIVSRIIIFPFWILHTSAIKSWEVVGPFQSCYLFNALLFVIQCLHLYWASIIMKMAMKMLFPKKGEPIKDDRSDEDEASTDEDQPNGNTHY